MRARLSPTVVAVAVLTLVLTGSGCSAGPGPSSVTPARQSSVTQSPPTSRAATTPPAVLSLARRSGLTIDGPPESSDDTLTLYTPANRDGLDEGILQASGDAGYDLRPYLLEQAQISAYPVRELDQHQYAQKLVVVEHAGKIIGAWVIVPDLIGGIRELKRGRVSTVP